MLTPSPCRDLLIIIGPIFVALDKASLCYNNSVVTNRLMISLYGGKHADQALHMLVIGPRCTNKEGTVGQG